MGMNNAGLAVGNSGVIPDTGDYNYQNAATSRYILSNFSTTDEVTAFFQTQNSFRITACYPFLDARGEVMMYEVLKPRETYEPRWLWLYDPLNPTRDAQGLLGIVPRANEHHESDVGMDDLSTGGRYETNRYNMVGLHDLGQLNAQTIIQGNNGSQGYEVIRYGPYRTLTTISNKKSQSAIIVHGVKPEEDPALTTMWVILGQPNYCIAVPTWITLGNNISNSLRLGLMWDRSRSLYTKGSLFTTQACIFPAEAHIFDMVYNEILPHWRTNGMPSVLEVIRVHHQIAHDAYSLLNCLDNTRHNNKAPVIGSIETNLENGMSVRRGDCFLFMGLW